MAQLLFLPISQLPAVKTLSLSQTNRGTGGFGLTDIKSFISEVIPLQPTAG